jgi:hypothetical protein
MTYVGRDPDPDEQTMAAHEKRIARCRSCNAQIVWFKTSSGSNMPVDESTVEADDVALDLTRHKSHFATCPNADHHRKKK